MKPVNVLSLVASYSKLLVFLFLFIFQLTSACYANIDLGQLKQQISKFKEPRDSLNYLESIQKDIKSLDPLTQGKYYIMLALVFEDLNDIQSAHDAYSAAISNLSIITPTSELITAYLDRSYMQYLMSNDAKLYCQDRELALISARELNDPESLAKALTSVSFCAGEKGKFLVGIKLLEEAISIAEKNALSFNRRAMIYNATAILYRKQRFFQRAEEYFEKALELWSAKNDKQDVFNMLHSLVANSLELKNFKQAEKYTKKLFELAKTSPRFSDFYFFAYLNSGFVHYRKKEYSEAIKEFSLALDRQSETKEIYFIRQAHYFLSYSYLRVNQLDLAIKSAEEYLALNPNKDIEPHKIIFANALLKIRSNENIESIQLLLDMANQIKEEYENRLNNSVIALSLDHDSRLSKFEKQLLDKKLAINELELQTERQNKKISHQTFTIIILVVVVLLAVVLFLLQSRRFFKKRSQTDYLTNIANRSYVVEKGKRILKSSNRQQRLSVVLFDLDNFKKINDNYGHDIGDKVIKAAASQAARWLRSGDIIGRIGGEEFLILLPNTDPKKSLEIAERIRQGISEKTFKFCEFDISFTISLGVATQKRDNQYIDELIRAADKALYQAKESGRNRACQVEC